MTDESPPYTIDSSEAGAREGFMVDIAREAFRNSGYEIQVEFVPYKRSIQEVVDGKADGVLLVSENSAPGLLYLKKAIAVDSVVFFAAKGNPWQYAGIESLDEVRIASGVGFDFADKELNAFIERREEERPAMIQLISGDDINLRNFKKLLLGRVDVVIATEKIGMYVAKRNGLTERLRVAGRVGAPIVAQTGFDPKKASSAKYARILSEGFAAMVERGRAREILAAYGLSE